MVIFHSYVKLPEGISSCALPWLGGLVRQAARRDWTEIQLTIIRGAAGVHLYTSIWIDGLTRKSSIGKGLGKSSIGKIIHWETPTFIVFEGQQWFGGLGYPNFENLETPIETSMVFDDFGW